MFGFFGLNQSTSSNDYVFNTGAGVAELLYPGRRVGLSYTRATKHYYLSNGIFFSDGLISDEDASKNGFNTSLRFVWRPINDENRLFHIGISGLYKIPDVNKETNKRRLVLSGKGITYLKSSELINLEFDDVKHQIETGLECYAFNNKWLFQGEYMRMIVNNNAKTSKVHGGYCQVGYLIKGKIYGYDQTDAVPAMSKANKSLMLIARFNMIDLINNGAFINNSIQQDSSIGLNYNLNGHISVKLSYNHLDFNNKAERKRLKSNFLQTRINFKMNQEFN